MEPVYIEEPSWADFWRRQAQRAVGFAVEMGLYFLLFFLPAAFQAKSVRDGDEARNSATAAATVAIAQALRKSLRKED